MKKMRNIFALLIAMVMVLGMSTMTAFAASDGSITVQNTVKDSTYNVYKVFDATYSGDNVAYSYDGSNETFLAALQADSSPFNCVKATSGGYSITVKTGVTDEDILTFIKGQEGNFGNAVDTFTGDGDTQVVSNLAYGYYYITTTTGTLVTIDSALKDVTVIDKNEVIPPPDKAEKVAAGTWTEEPESGNESATGNIGDTVNYKVTGSFKRYQGEELVTKITFTDTMSEGLTPNKDVVIKINGTEVSVTPTYSNSDRTWTAEITTATVADDGTITFNYDTPSTYEITYSAVINENAKIADPENNTFTLKYNDKGDQEHSLVTTLQILQQILCLVAVGSEIGRNNIHVIAGADSLLLFLDLHLLQVGHLALDILDRLRLIDGLDMNIDADRVIELQEVRKELIGQLGSEDLKE